MQPHKDLLVQISRDVPSITFRVLKKESNQDQLNRALVILRPKTARKFWYLMLEALLNTDNLDVYYFNDHWFVHVYFNHTNCRMFVKVNSHDFYNEFLFACNQFNYLEPLEKINWRKEGF